MDRSVQFIHCFGFRILVAVVVKLIEFEQENFVFSGLMKFSKDDLRTKTKRFESVQVLLLFLLLLLTSE